MEVHFSHQGASTQFTVSLDLESPGLAVWQQTPSGFQKLRLHVDPEKGLLLTAVRGSCVVRLIDERSTLSTLSTQLKPKESILLLPKELFHTMHVHTMQAVPFERLSLGSHKAQEVVPFTLKRDLFSLLPMWMRLGALMPCLAPLLHSGTAALLKNICLDQHEQRVGATYEATLHTLLRTAFSDLFVPRLTDHDHQGDPLSAPVEDEDPLILLTEGSKRLRASFLHVQGNKLHLLPGIPPSFHAGRLLNASCGEMGLLHFEWTKRCLRQMHFCAHQTGTMQLELPGIRRFRLRLGGTSKRVVCSADQEIPFCLGQNLFFDKFEC